MKRILLAMGLLLPVILLQGCSEDQRSTEKKQHAPAPDFNTRRVMACPKCGAPQHPFRISAVKSYYRCTGIAPKFPYHDEKQWSRRIKDSPESDER